jgi:hypothetical protein
MLIQQQPDALSFENNLPDIIIQKTGSEASIVFRLYQGATLIVEEDYIFDTDGFVYIRDLANVVKYYFNDTVVNESNYMILTGLVKQFNFTIDAGTVHNFTVIRSSAEINGYTAPEFVGSSFLSRIAQKRTHLHANEFLSLFVYGSDQIITVSYRIFYEQNNQLHDLSGTFLTINDIDANDKVVVFNASLDAVIQAAQITPTRVYEYRIQAKAFQFTFFPDYSNYAQKKLFVFKNCFGCPETFVATGNVVSTSNLDVGYSITGKRMKKTTQDFEKLYQCNSGYLSEDERDWLDDFITSFSVSLLKGSELHDITITAADKSNDTANTLQFFEFSYRFMKTIHLEFSKSIAGIFDHTFDNTFN